MFSQVDSTSESFYSSGQLWRVADFLDGKINGQLKYYYKNGQLMEKAIFSNGKRKGEYMKFDSLGNIEFNYNYVNGEREGVQKLYYKNGNLKSEEYIQDKRNVGIQKYYYENGNLKEQYSRNRIGQYNGIFERYHENGQLKLIGQYDNVQLYESGEWKYYDSKGNLIKKQLRNGIESKTIFTTQDFLFEVWNDTARFVFSDFTIICPNSSFSWQDDKADNEELLPEVEIELGNNIEQFKFKILGENMKDPKLAIRKEFSFAMSNEGPHIELINWKHSYSEWMPLIENENSYFLINNFVGLEINSVPTFKKEEMEEAIRSHAGENWVKLYYEKYIGKESWVPASAQLKISYTNSEGSREEKVIRFIIPMGC